MALFPFLFPAGVGHYSGGQLTHYLAYRFHCFFSVFTLYKPYLLLMFQVRQAVVIANQCSECVLSEEVERFKKKNPTASREESHFLS